MRKFAEAESFFLLCKKKTLSVGLRLSKLVAKSPSLAILLPGKAHDFPLFLCQHRKRPPCRYRQKIYKAIFYFKVTFCHTSAAHAAQSRMFLKSALLLIAFFFVKDLQQNWFPCFVSFWLWLCVILTVAFLSFWAWLRISYYDINERCRNCFGMAIPLLL